MNSASVSLADSSIRFGCAQPHILVSSFTAAILSGMRSFTGLTILELGGLHERRVQRRLSRRRPMMTLQRNSIVCSRLRVALRELASLSSARRSRTPGTIHPVGRITIGLLTGYSSCYLAICVGSG